MVKLKKILLLTQICHQLINNLHYIIAA